jgi:hypothetical protein
MNKKTAKALANIIQAAEAISEGYLMNEWNENPMHPLEVDRLCQYIIQDVATILLYNRKPQTRARYAQNPGE